MECEKCGSNMSGTGVTDEYPDCNTWTCDSCHHVIPEMGSYKMSYPVLESWRSLANRQKDKKDG